MEKCRDVQGIIILIKTLFKFIDLGIKVHFKIRHYFPNKLNIVMGFQGCLTKHELTIK